MLNLKKIFFIVSLISLVPGFSHAMMRRRDEPGVMERIGQSIKNHKIAVGTTITTITAATIYLAMRQCRATGQGMYRAPQNVNLF